jgi:SNF2 family DNA or RNA helicase
MKFDRPLRKHQQEILERFYAKNEAAIFHEMGTGKSTSAIALLRSQYITHKEVLPTLIISPVATLYNWENEFKINAPQKIQDEVVVLYGSAVKRLATIKSGKKIFITNPEMLQMDEVVNALYKMGIASIVIDESHKFKEHKSKRFKTLAQLTRKAKYKIIMTGTPILNSYLDLWAQFYLLDGGKTLGENFYVFRNQYFYDKNEKWKARPGYFPDFHPRPQSDAELSKKIDSISSRVLKSECLDLPPQVFETMHVELNAEQKKAYKSMVEEMISFLQDAACAAPNALTRVLRLLQIVSGHIEVENTQGIKFTAVFEDIPRIKLLKELLEEHCPRSKIIVWCTFSKNYALVRRVCEELSLQFAELTGETKDRQTEIDKFNNDPKCRVMISNPQAGGVGVNLTASDISIYYSRNFSLGDRLQSEARNHRGGSEIHKTITVIDIVAKDTIDEDVLAALLRKENYSDNVLNKLKQKFS